MIEYTGNIQVHHDDQPRRTPKACPPNCACQQDDAMTTPLQLEDIK